MKPPTLMPLLRQMEGQPLPYQPHSATSRIAAIRAEPKAGTQRARVLEFIRNCGSHGATDFEGIRALGGHAAIQNAYRARRIELAEAGLIRKADFRRHSPAGLECDVWVGSNTALAPAVSQGTGGNSRWGGEE